MITNKLQLFTPAYWEGLFCSGDSSVVRCSIFVSMAFLNNVVEV